MANHPAEYPWSSYRYHALGKSNPLVTPHQNINGWVRLTRNDKLIIGYYFVRGFRKLH